MRVAQPSGLSHPMISGKRRTPTTMPCCQVFEPGVQSGHRLASLGFSVEQNMHTETREGSRCNCCWVKECLPITSMAGATIFSVMQRITYTYNIFPGKTVKIVGSLKSAKVKGKALVINRSFKSVFDNKTRIAIHCVLSFNLPIRFVVLWATSCNNLE